jgi:DNA-directed RNA polymerase beta' subunit
MQLEVSRLGRITEFINKLIFKSMETSFLKNLTFAPGEVLTRSQMKKVLGGTGVVASRGGVCNYRKACDTGCATFTDATEQHGTCDNCCVATTT